MPWLLRVTTRSLLEHGDVGAVEEHVGHPVRAPAPGPAACDAGQVAALHQHPGGAESVDAAGQVGHGVDVGVVADGSTPARMAASNRLGVTTRAWGSSPWR